MTDILAVAVVPLVVLAVLIVLVTHPLDGRSVTSEVGDGAGKDGIGDHYFPGMGGRGFDVDTYRIDLTWDGKSLRGHATIKAVASEELDKIHLDLVLDPSAATVDGAEAKVDRDGVDDLTIVPKKKVRQGATFEVTVDYAGDPKAKGRKDVDIPWYQDGDTVTAVGEPYVASWWFPANDHPRDEANFDVTMTVPAGFEALTVGSLLSRDERADPGTDTWHWRTDKPIVTYATFMSVGQYRIETGTVQGPMTASRPFLYAVTEQLPKDQQDAAFKVLRSTPTWVGELEKIYGRYPLSDIGGVVVPHRLTFAGMETQGRPVYLADSILDEDFQNRLIVHEMAHMWFGDTVNLENWSDIFLNEGYAAHSEWLVSEQRGRSKANDTFKNYFDDTDDRFWSIKLDDPGPDQLFDTVYERGPMALQSLRNILGDKEFSALNKEWALQDGPRTIDDWYQLAQSHTKTDLTAWRAAWFSSTSKPTPSKELGFP